MNLKSPIDHKAAIVYSASLDRRNNLRSQVGQLGYRAVCFENENICFDNFDPIQPNIVIAETDSVQVVWRFIFALHTHDVQVPLVIVSDRLNANAFSNKGLQTPVYTIAMDRLGEQLLEKAIQNRLSKNVRGKGYNRKRLPLFVGLTERISQLRSMLPSIAETCDPVLISGARGTGKKLLARLIVDQPMGKKSVIEIDCGQVRTDTMSDGSIAEIMGRGDKGNGVTIFLNHLDQLPISAQAEMLLLIEGATTFGKGTGTGSNGVIRFIAASDQNIDRLVQRGEFRKDLYYRLNVLPIKMPALRDRKADIPLLMDYFMIKACIENQVCVRVPSSTARELCAMHPWPGNVTELQNQMTRAVTEGNESHLLDNTGICSLDKTNEYLLSQLAVEELPKSYEIKDYLSVFKNLSLKGICNEFVAKTERRLVKRALESTSWNRKKAAELLNISYKTMLNKIKTYDIV